jgi:choline dehydrogenase-like flavoprotein
MLIDSTKIPKGKIIETDVCIIGAGAAGITIAKEFINKKVSVCLLESGGFKFNEDTQSLYNGYETGVGESIYLYSTRLRYFGGTTNHWAGFCRPLDEIDFEKRPWYPYSGWPFSKTHLKQYYERAFPLVEIKSFDYDIDELFGSNRPRFIVGNDDRVTTKMFHFSPTRSFGIVYRDEIIRAENIDVYLHANVVDIQTNDWGTTANRVKVACLTGNEFSVQAKIFVLATGGIENARLLLLSNKAGESE